MNKIWYSILLVSICLLIYTNPENILPAMLKTSEESLKLCANLIAIYAVWMGIMQIMEDCGINYKLAKLLSPITHKLFGKIDDKTNEFICMNISANMLGMGGASTPLGIEAMKRMDNGSGVATRGMIMFFVLNATSLQLLPTTVIGLRASNGSLNPYDIILPSLITTIVTTLLAVLLVIFCDKLRQKNILKKKKI